jgi:hypothetical protein
VRLERTQLQRVSKWALRIAAVAVVAMFFWPLVKEYSQHPLLDADKSFEATLEARAKKRNKVIAEGVRGGRNPADCETGIKK